VIKLQTEEKTNYINFYHLYPKGQRLKIEQAPVGRQWMDDTGLGYAYRCLPMTYANRHGWCVRLTEDVQVIWDGSAAASGTHILTGRTQNGISMADNGTGNGVVTFHLNAIPRTPPDWNLWIMGAPNLVIPGASALSGVIESDWMFTSPTANWKLTEPNRIITFKKGDPVFFFVPVHKTMFETFEVNHLVMQEDEDMNKHYVDHAEWRQETEAAGKGVFGKMYLKGIRADGTKPEWEHNHKTRLHLQEPDPNL
jgi:hypothetical protein